MSDVAFLVITVVKIVVVFTAIMVGVALLTPLDSLADVGTVNSDVS